VSGVGAEVEFCIAGFADLSGGGACLHPKARPASAINAVCESERIRVGAVCQVWFLRRA
jgi:hypothetical protein